jgi:glucose/mannose-6-phosphate isomerase
MGNDMKQLDDLKVIHKVDQQNMLDLIHNFSNQMKQAEEIGLQATIDDSLLEGITEIMFSGLGGSAIGADFIRSYLLYETTIPMFVNRHYRVPGLVDGHTLFIASSYSGNTEETLLALDEAIRRKVKVLAITSGGELAQIARKNGYSLIEIPKGISPRAALGYSVIPLLIALKRAGLNAAYKKEDLKEARDLVRTLADTQYGVSIPFEKNLAKQIAAALKDKLPIIYAGTDFFDVIALRWRGQIEENAKAIASHHILPEMNHNELVGWKYPTALLKQAVVMILRDEADYVRVSKRMDLIRGIIEPLAGKTMDIQSQGSSLLARMFSLVHLGDWISLYLAVLNNIDPTPVEVINYLKGELAKEPVT